MAKKVQRFFTVYNAATSCLQNGKNEQDVIRIGTGFLNEKAMKVETDNWGKPFEIFKAWEILCKLPKFQAKKPKASASVTEEETSGSANREVI